MRTRIKGWEDIAETLSSEVKREIAEEYFSEKKFLEESWENYQRDIKEMDKLEERLLKNVFRLVMMLRDDDLIEEFKKITGFDLKGCYFQQVLESENLKKILFKKLGAPFAFTTKNRFVKLFLEIYKDLQESAKAYDEKLKAFQEYYEELVKDTEAFHKRFDISAILGFFSKLSSGEQPEIGETEDKGQIYEELSSKLKIKKAPPPTAIHTEYVEPRPLRDISGELIRLAKTAFNRHKWEGKELLDLASAKD
jgi:hypothetical protein